MRLEANGYTEAVRVSSEQLVQIVLFVDARRSTLSEHAHRHVNAKVQLLHEVGAYEEPGAVESVRTMHADELGGMLSRKVFHNANK